MFNKIKNLFHKKNKESDIAIQDEENIKPANKPCTCPEEISSQYYGPFCPRCFGTRLQYYLPQQNVAQQGIVDAALLMNQVDTLTKDDSQFTSNFGQQIAADPSFSGFASGDSGGAGASDDYGSGAYTCTDSSVSCGTDSSLSCDTSSTDSSCADSGNF